MKQLDETKVPNYWEGFNGGDWQEEINVRDFIEHNLNQYDGDRKFPCWPH